jgi:hypothetical protein
MLNALQRWIIFGLFCLATIILIGTETYLAWAMIEKGFTAGKGVAAVLSSGLLAGCGIVFRKLLEANFLKQEVLPMSRLHRLTSERSSLIENARNTNQTIYETRRSFIVNTLRFAEETMRSWVLVL